ncbi:MAG: electron transport complex subunit RsxE [Pseudomonadales bacterium]
MSGSVFRDSALANNPAWAQLLGLCPLLAVSNNVANALGLAAASALVMIGANGTIAALRRHIPDFARLPCFVLIIATFTTIALLVLQALAYEIYLKIALFVQIIVTNCMILGRAEAFASRQPVGAALADAAGTAAGFALALVVLGATRELLATGGLLAGMESLLGPVAAGWHFRLADSGLLLAALPPGAFIVAGLLLAAMNAGGRWYRQRRGATPEPSEEHEAT